MHILLTNDDGFDAPGLSALYRAVCDEHRVTAAAPSSERSSCGHGATLIGPITVRRVEHDVMGPVFAVSGTPADCVRLAVAHLATEPIDLVISGINLGANVSIVDIAQSGTVAGAREAAFCGIRGIAVSQLYSRSVAVDWDRATRLARRLIPQIVATPNAPRVFWNVNFPAMPPGREPGGVCVVPLARDHVPLEYADDAADLNRGRAYRYNGYYLGRVAPPGTDVAAVFGGDVAITPIGIDPTDVAAMETRFTL